MASLADDPQGSDAKIRRIHPELDASPRGEFDEIGALGGVAGALRRALAERGVLPADIREVRATVAEVTGERSGITEPQIEALIALGVLGRVSSGGREQLVWMRDGAPTTPTGPQVVDSPPRDPESEAFRLALEIDIERERLLLYRVGLAGLATFGVLLLRQLATGLL